MNQIEKAEEILCIRALMKRRENARKLGQFDESDAIRKQLIDIGVKVIDQKNGPSGWKFVDSNLTNKIEPNVSNSVELKRKIRSIDDEASHPPQQLVIAESKKAKLNSIIEHDSKHQLSTPTATLSCKKSPTHSKICSELDRIKKCASNIVQNQSKIIDGIVIEDVSIGGGVIAKNGNKIKVHYVGRLKSNNRVFDSSTKKPFQFRLGRGEVIRGWDIGCAGMKEGGKRRLVIPPEKAYGKSGAPPAIPGNSTLTFDITLLQVSQ